LLIEIPTNEGYAMNKRQKKKNEVKLFDKKVAFLKSKGLLYKKPNVQIIGMLPN